MYSNTYPQPQPPFPATGGPPRKRRRWPWVIGIVATLVFGFSLGAAGSTAPEPEIVTETVTETVTEEVEVEVEPADLQEQRDAADDRDGEMDARETELEEWAEELESQESDLVTREEEFAADQEAEESEEETVSEEEASEEQAPGSTIPGDGVFLVGDDVQPGTYRSEPGVWGCYWARLSGTSGEFHDIITNGFVDDGQALITVSETDVAFETSGCGEWSQQ